MIHLLIAVAAGLLTYAVLSSVTNTGISLVSGIIVGLLVWFGTSWGS